MDSPVLTSAGTNIISQGTDTHSPAVPAYILRGHTAAIHALRFFHQNAYLASGDSDGWIVVWSLASKRAVAVWKAHEGAILGVRDWIWEGGSERLVTHGRDHRLRVWQLGSSDLEALDTRLPVEREDAGQEKEPWLIHSLSVNALNFCAFAMCYDQDEDNGKSLTATMHGLPAVPNRCLANEITDVPWQPRPADRPIIVAVSNALISGAIDFFHLPSERRVSTLPPDKDVKTGMVMALSLSKHATDGSLMVVAGYESGHALVYNKQTSNNPDQIWSWKKVLVSQPHSQPLLSLDVSPIGDSFFTSSADAIIAKFAIPTDTSTLDVVGKPNRILNTKHAGQQGLTVRSDGKILATAGWDARIRVYSVKAVQELAVLKWHKEGCYAVSFATINPEQVPGTGWTGQTLVPGRQSSTLDAIKDHRYAKARNTHWLAAGGKDGKISLWDIY